MQGGGREQANRPARANAVAGRDRRVAHVEATWSRALDIQKEMSGARHSPGISSALSPAPKLFFPPRTFRQIADSPSTIPGLSVPFQGGEHLGHLSASAEMPRLTLLWRQS